MTWHFDPDNEGNSFRGGYGLLDDNGKEVGVFIETGEGYDDEEQREKAVKVAALMSELPTTIKAVRAEELRQELVQALYLLIHTYLTLTRREYEDGMTHSELEDRVCEFLWNHRLQPSLPEHNENVRQFLSDYQAQFRVRLPSAEQILERMRAGTEEG